MQAVLNAFVLLVALAQSTSEAPTLSVGPLPEDAVRHAKDFPSWALQAPDLEGELHQWPVITSPNSSDQKCEEELRVQIRQAVDQYVQQYLADKPKREQVHLSESFVSRHVLDPKLTYQGTVVWNDELLREHAQMLNFGPTARAEIDRQWEESVLQERLARTGVVGAGLLSLLAIAGLYLRADNATRGYYTGRLRLAAAGAGAAAIAGSLAAWRYFV
jgi:hypothetical protein